jgi:hypothetical protein
MCSTVLSHSLSRDLSRLDKDFLPCSVKWFSAPTFTRPLLLGIKMFRGPKLPRTYRLLIGGASTVEKATLCQPMPQSAQSSSTEALPESFVVWLDFSTLVCSSVEALPESYGYRQRVSAQVPQVYQDFGLSGFPRHYLGVDDLSIIVSYLITSLMLFMHLHIVW